MKKRPRSMFMACQYCGEEMKHPCRLTEKGREWYCWNCGKIIASREELE